MPKYVEADKLISAIMGEMRAIVMYKDKAEPEELPLLEAEHTAYYNSYMAAVKLLVEDLDAIPVVRCRQCAFAEAINKDGDYICKAVQGVHPAYWFCYYGERRIDDA